MDVALGELPPLASLRASARPCAPPRPRAGITYPYARGPEGRLIHVDQHDQGTVVSCLGCGDPMISRGGRRTIRKHFAHRPDAGGSCSQETALHAAAKQAICDAFAMAKSSQLPYVLRWSCPSCETARSADLVVASDRVVPEDEMVPGVRSDLAFHGRRRFAVEVVVTHPPEQQTLDRYKAADVPMFVVRPEWDTVAKLAQGVDAAESYFSDTSKCSECRRRRDEAEALELEHGRMMQRLQQARRAVSGQPPPVRLWYTDARGHELFPRVTNALHASGRRLLAAGFRQAQAKPWLFVLNVPGVGSFFANLGGTPEVPIWEDRTPLLHWRFDARVAECHEGDAVDMVRDYLQTLGIEVRTSFYSPY